MLFLKKTMAIFFISCFLSTTTAAGDLSVSQDPLNSNQIINNASDSERAYTEPVRYYQVKNNDTIWSIASQYIPEDKSVNEYQIIASIYRNNPKAFGDGNLNSLHKVNLKIPSNSAIALEKEQSGRELIKKGKIKLPELPQNNTEELFLSKTNSAANNYKNEKKEANLDISSLSSSELEDVKEPASLNNFIDNNKIKDAEIEAEEVKNEKSENKNDSALEILNQVIEPLSSQLDTKLTDLKNEIKSLNDSYNESGKKAELAQKQLADFEDKYEGSVSSLAQDLTYVKDRINRLEGENSLLKDQAQFYKEQLSKLETRLQNKEEQSLSHNSFLQNILSICSIFLVLLCLLALLKVLKTNNSKEKVKLITYSQPIIEEQSKRQESLIPADEITKSNNDKNSEKDADNIVSSIEETQEKISDIKNKEGLNSSLNNKSDENDLNDCCAGLNTHKSNNQNDHDLNTASDNTKKRTKSLRKRERPYIKSNNEINKNSIKAGNEFSDAAASAVDNQDPLKKFPDAAIEKADLIKNLYQNDDDFEDIDYEEYDPGYQKYKDKLALAQVYIDTGDIDEALEMLLEIKDQADPYLANKAEILIKKYADY